MGQSLNLGIYTWLSSWAGEMQPAAVDVASQYSSSYPNLSVARRKGASELRVLHCLQRIN